MNREEYTQGNYQNDDPYIQNDQMNEVEYVNDPQFNNDPYSGYQEDQAQYDPGNYQEYDYNNYGEEKSSFSLMGLLGKILLVLLVILLIFFILIQIDVVKGFDNLKIANWFGEETSEETQEEDNGKEESEAVNSFQGCKEDGGAVDTSELPVRCEKDGTVFFQEASESDLQKQESEEEREKVEDGIIVLAPQNQERFSKFVVGDGYPDFQNGITAYSANLHENWSSWAYMIINNPNLPSVGSKEQEYINKTISFIGKGADYNEQPYLFKAFEISENQTSTTYFLGDIDEMSYSGADGSRAIYALDGEGAISRLVVRVFAKKGSNVIMLEENLDKNDNQALISKYYQSCITDKGAGDSAKDCYAEKLQADNDFQNKTKEMANALTTTFVLE